jgi:hypothetical protein
MSFSGSILSLFNMALGQRFEGVFKSWRSVSLAAGINSEGRDTTLQAKPTPGASEPFTKDDFYTHHHNNDDRNDNKDDDEE